MTREEHLLTILAEECVEVAQRVSKALRFGLTEIQKGATLDNAERIVDELHDLIAVATILEQDGILWGIQPNADRINDKLRKIECYFDISRAQGTLQASRTALAGSKEGSRDE